MNVLRNLTFGLPPNAEGLNHDNLLFKEIPFLRPWEFEQLDSKSVSHFMSEYWWVGIVVGAIYLLVIFSLKEYMSRRKAIKLDTAFFLWNTALGILSIAGFLRLVTELIHTIFYHGFYASICKTDTITRGQLFWGFLFVFSKIPELGDTVFIVLKKRPLIFLQWYHHLTTMLSCWLAAPFVEPMSIYYALVNFGVHSFMYPYFAAKTLNLHPPRWVPNAIVTLQLGQMYVLLGLNAYTLAQIALGNSCRRFPLPVVTSNAMLVSFAIIFGTLYSTVTAKSKTTQKLKEH